MRKKKRSLAKDLKWLPWKDVDSIGRGIWRKGDLQCIVTLRRLTIAHKTRIPSIEEYKDALDRFWIGWQPLAELIKDVEHRTPTEHMPQIRHFFRTDLYAEPEEMEAEIQQLFSERIVWTNQGGIVLEENQAHAKLILGPNDA